MPDFTPTSLDATRTEPGFIGWSDNGPIFRAPAADFALIGEGPPFWPRADGRIQRADTDGGSMLGGPGKGLWHTTETDGWPGYSTGSFPHLTVRIEAGQFVARQHIPFTRAARALRNESGGVQTNRITRCQVEIVTRADIVDERGLDPAMEDGLAALAEWLAAEWGVPRTCMVTFKTYPASFGAGNGVRLSGAAWEAYTGWLGHMHAAENLHGDPGALDWRRILLEGDWLDMATKEEVKDALREVLGLSADGHLLISQTGQVNNDKALQVLVDRLAGIKAALDALAAAQHTPDELAALLAPLQAPILAPLLADLLPAQTQPPMSGTVRLTAEPPA